MSKHTPGPWKVGGPTGFRNQCAIEPSICAVYGAGAELEANAQLIAAAPDLLAALKAIAAALDAPRDRLGGLETTMSHGDALLALRQRYGTGACRDNIDGSVLVARAAIAKAEGKQ